MKFAIFALWYVISCAVTEQIEENPDGPYEFYTLANRRFPPNALIAGYEIGARVHIGVTSLAGKVIGNRKLLEMVNEDGKVITQMENFWVLTTDQPEIFRWIPAKYHDIVIPVPVKPVSFGVLGRKYIVRAGSNNETTIGTLHCDSFPNSCGVVMGVNRMGRAETYYKFDILVYAA